MYEFLDDPVDVLATFTRNRVRPLRMRWQDKTYDIKRVNLIHTGREGTKRLFYFSVSDDANAFKLKLDPEILEWRLVELYADG
ncbi:MAG: hypothetical protein AAB865_01920 [Patescibacteria group bacterium]